MSLLPTEVAAVRAQRRQVGVVAAALAALAVLLVALWLGRTSQVTGERDQAERTESQAARLRQQANQLGQVTTVEAQLNERRRQVQLALADDVGWTRLVQEIAQVLPSDVWLTNFQGQKSGGATATGAQPAQPSGGAAAAPTSGVGTVNVTGMGFDQSSAARWLLRVGDLQSLTGVWLPSSTKGPGNAPITFTSTADLTDRVRTGQERVQQYVGAQG